MVIPAKIGNEVITGIRNNAFYDCKGLTSLDLSACTSLTVIGVEADTYLRMGAFGGCTGLTEVKLPASLTEIGKKAFKNCVNLTSAVFADKNDWKADSTPIDPSDLDNAATAAEYLRQTYVYKFWKKN